MIVRYQDIAKKKILITGGASGIGAALVDAFVAQGARVAFIDVDARAGEALCEDLMQKYQVKPIFCEFDLSQSAHIKGVIQDIVADLGSVDVLLNNAASDVRHAASDVTPESWQQCLDVNLSHQFFCAQAVYPGMVRQGGGAIINFGSVSYMMALENLPVYQTAKAGIVGLTRSLAREWGGDGIRVNTIVPGCIMTPKQLQLWISPEDEARIQERQCLKRRLVSEDVAQMALFLASDVSSACSAQSFVVDGGIV